MMESHVAVETSANREQETFPHCKTLREACRVLVERIRLSPYFTRENVTTGTIAVLALTLFTFRVGFTQLKDDEYCTWWAIHLSLTDLFRLLHNVDAVMAPYYLLLKAWSGLFGDSEAALRVPSLLTMAAAAALITRIGQRIAGVYCGLLSGLCFLFVPMTSRMSQLARPYSFAMLLAVASTWLLLRCLDQPKKKRNYILYSASIALLGAFHFVALTILFAHLVLVMVGYRSLNGTRLGVSLRWTTAVVAGLLPLLPLILLGASQSGQLRLIEIEKTSLVNVVTILGERFTVRCIVAMAAVALLHRSPKKWALAAWAVAPPILLYFTYNAIHIYRPRYVLFTIAAWSLLCGLGVEQLRARLRYNAVVIAGFVLTLGVPYFRGQKSWYNSEAQRESHRLVGNVLHSHATREDAIIYGGRSAERYHKRIGVAYAMRGYFELHDVLMRDSASERGSFDATECSPSRNCPAIEHQRIWVVTKKSQGQLTTTLSPAKASLFENYRQEKVWNCGDLSLGLLVRDRQKAGS